MNGNIDNMDLKDAYATRCSEIGLQLGLSIEFCNRHLKRRVKSYRDGNKKISDGNDITW